MASITSNSISRGVYRTNILSPRVDTTRIQTSTNAEVTWTFDTPFANNPIVQAICEIDDYKPYWVHITDLSTTSVSFLTSTAQDVDPSMAGTPISTSSSDIVTAQLGLVTFTVPAALGISAGNSIVATTADAGSGKNQMFGTIDSYSGTTLVINVTSMSTVAGSYGNWTLDTTATLSIYQGIQCWIHASAKET